MSNSFLLKKIERIVEDDLRILIQYRWRLPIRRSRAFTNGKDRIVIKKTLSTEDKIHAILHELAHIFGGIDYSTYTKPVAEVMAESVAWSLLCRIELDTSYSERYIRGWKEDDQYSYSYFHDYIIAKTTELVYDKVIFPVLVMSE